MWFCFFEATVDLWQTVRKATTVFSLNYSLAPQNATVRFVNGQPNQPSCNMLVSGQLTVFGAYLVVLGLSLDALLLVTFQDGLFLSSVFLLQTIEP